MEVTWNLKGEEYKTQVSLIEDLPPLSVQLPENGLAKLMQGRGAELMCVIQKTMVIRVMMTLVIDECKKKSVTSDLFGSDEQEYEVVKSK